MISSRRRMVRETTVHGRLTVRAVVVIVMNYAYVIGTYWNRLRGIDRHFSTIPFVPQMLLVLAGIASAIAEDIAVRATPALASSMHSTRALPRLWLLGLAL